MPAGTRAYCLIASGLDTNLRQDLNEVMDPAKV